MRDIAEIMHDTNADCLCRPQPLDDPANSTLQDMIAKCRASALGHGLDSSIFHPKNEKFINPTSSGAIYKRGVFAKVGMYDESFDACEDVELNHRVWTAGLSSYISPRLTVRYSPRDSIAHLFKQMARYGQGRFRFISKHPGAISVGQIIPPGFVLWLLIAAILATQLWWARYALVITLAVYAAAVLLSTIHLAARHGLRFLWNAPAIYFAIHFGLGLGFWKGVFTPSAKNIQAKAQAGY